MHKDYQSRCKAQGSCKRHASGDAKGIIALDLDGTLLNSKKELSDRNLQALHKAYEAGWEIVPTTGRFYNGMPEAIRQLPFVRYVITINGAEAADIKTGEVIYKAEMPWKKAVEIMEWLDDKDVIYDCYMRNHGWMTAAQKELIDEVVESPHSRKMLHELRNPVDELKAFLKEEKHDVQKVQFFMRDVSGRPKIMKQLAAEFEGIVVSSALPQNVEINEIHANKGEALMALADHLGLSREKTISFGDGLNDLPMIRDAGIGICMENGAPEVKAAADWIAPTCDEDGVAVGIEKFIPDCE